MWVLEKKNKIWRQLEDNVMDTCPFRDSKNYIGLDYKRILIRMVDDTNLIVLNGIIDLPFTNFLPCYWLGPRWRKCGKSCINEGMWSPIVEVIETHCSMCVDVRDVNKGTKR